MVERRSLRVGTRRIGAEHPCFIIAEAGVNHNGELELAEQLVGAAVEAGADAVKFQTFKAERVVSRVAPKADYQLSTTDTGESQLEMVRRLELSADAHRRLHTCCAERNILFMSSPFDEESADLLNELGVAAFKIPSGEITNLPFLRYVARMGRPLIVSTGMSNLAEVATAVRAVEETGNKELALLHCVSNYPANPADINLRAMHTMAAAFGVPVGYSDHTRGLTVALAAVAMGASVIEKHFTLSRDMVGPDHKASLEPHELAELVYNIRTVEAALGDGRKEPAASEANTASVARKSLVAAEHIPAGTSLTDRLIAVMRPGTGFPPAMKSCLIGRTVQLDVAAGELFTPEMFA